MDPMEALVDLYQRLVDAEAEISVKARDRDVSLAEGARLTGKAEGVALARDYVRHTMAIVGQQTPA